MFVVLMWKEGRASSPALLKLQRTIVEMQRTMTDSKARLPSKRQILRGKGVTAGGLNI